MADNDGWEPIHPAAQDDGWEPIAKPAASLGDAFRGTAEVPPDFGNAQVMPGETTRGVQQLGAAGLDVGKQAGNLALMVPNTIAAGLGGLFESARTGDLSKGADVARDWQQPVFGEGQQTPTGKALAGAINYPFENIAQSGEMAREAMPNHPALGAIAETGINALPWVLGGLHGSRPEIAPSLAEAFTERAQAPTPEALKASETVSATDAPPSASDALKGMVEQVKAQIAQTLNPPPVAAIAPKPRGRLNLQTGKVEPADGRPNEAAPVADSGSAGASVLPASDSAAAPENAARAAATEAKPAAPPLPPGTPVDASASVPLAGGVADEPNGPQVVIDKRMPQFVTVPDRNGNPVQIDVHEAVGAHERTEHPIMHEDGADYADAHDTATKAENAFVEQKYNVDPAKYQAALADHIAKAREEAPKEPANIPANLDEKPYTDGGDEKLLEPVKDTTSETSPRSVEQTQPVEQNVPQPDRMQELRAARDANTATPEQLHELTRLQDTAAHTADVGGELIPGVLNARGRAQLEASGQMKPVLIKTDLDDFKTINDTLGHEVGDEALRLKAEAMREAFGEGNSWRNSGDEFGAHADSEEAAHAAMQKVRDKLAGAKFEAVDAQGKPVADRPLGVSYGTGRGTTHEAAKQAAENALQSDKAARKAAGLRIGERRAPSDIPGMGGRREGEGRGEVPPSASGQEVAVAEPPTQTAPVKAQPKAPADTAVTEPSGTEVRNAAVDKQRDTLGLSELPAPEREHWQDAADKAGDAIAKGEINPRTLAAEVSAKPRALSTVETMALAHDLKSLSDEHAAATSDALSARERGDTTGETQALLRQSAATDAMETNHAALRNGGTEAARSLSVRNAILKDDYTVGRNMDRARVAYGDKFNDTLRKQVEDLSAQLKAAQDRAAKIEADVAARRQTAQSKKAAEKMTPDEQAQARIQKQMDALQKTIADRVKVCPI
jgi:diguanylate cyclase (GGDEF)-like protein